MTKHIDTTIDTFNNTIINGGNNPNTRCVFLLCIFRYWVPYCDVRYDFLITTMFGSSLLSVVCSRAHVLFTLLCLFANSGIQHIVFYFYIFFWGGVCFCYFFGGEVSSCVPYVAVSLDCPILIASSLCVFSNVYVYLFQNNRRNKMAHWMRLYVFFK
jgi:hypothetical protein